jgi:hypothetical protein
MAFRLDKYYFDAVSSDGRAFIGYSARLRWGLFRLNYHGGLWMDAKGAVRTTDRFFTAPRPNLGENTVDWPTPVGHGRYRSGLSNARSSSVGWALR